MEFYIDFFCVIFKHTYTLKKKVFNIIYNSFENLEIIKATNI